MKKIIPLLVLLVSITLSAQTNYEKGMTKALKLWEDGKITEASALFERISNVEKNEWLPPYYVATLEILSSFGLKDENKLSAKLKKAQDFLDQAKSISENNPEIIINQALLNTAYIAFDGRKYGMSLSMKNTELYKKALALAPKNPRVILGKAEWDMGTARFFKQSLTPYCKDVKIAIQLFEKEKLPQFYPKYGLERAKEIIQQCK